ncbi:glycerol-3-phosphate dehydrogenase/oxidase [Aestuariivirga sp.]|uniref:glycerol-3-phosphate dehydrogenase/oxidase n=1 Tax=Aestuariivirga sp. TaxID=2650926 RepID=UPI0039E2EC09
MAKTPSLKQHYSVLIIGAGINGCGTFRDLSLQGVDCLLIDKGDICQGASAAPSRLIHGGIKYLETREFRLVKESAMERNRLLRNAPHYVKALETVFPSRSWFAGLVPAALGFLGFNPPIRKRGAILIELGLRIYDFYSRKVQVLPDHYSMNTARLRQEYPALAPDLMAAGVYCEGRVSHAERLGMELVQDGLAANPASALRTYMAVDGRPNGKVLTLKDQISGETHAVTADVVINAGGAWIDKVNAGMGINSQHMGGSKGAHLIVKNAALYEALKGRMLYFGTSDGRFNLIYPFFGNVLVGSTDIPCKDPDLAHCSTEEADYLLDAVRQILPGVPVSRDDVVLTYCGVRPLPRAEGKDIGAVTRDHAIGQNKLPGTDIPVLSLIGGKWTTHRAFSEQTADAVLALLNKPRKLSTEDMAIGGGRNYPKGDAARTDFIARLAKELAVPTQQATILFERYGTTALALKDALSGTGSTPLASLPSYCVGEIAWICENEQVRRLADLVLRRTVITMEGLLTSDVISETAEIAAKTLGWDAKHKQAEIAFAEAEMAKRSIRNTRPEKAAA